MPATNIINRNTQFSQRQLDIITGSMLGDGSLSKVRSPKENPCFCEAHSLAQKQWLLWKHNELKPFGTSVKYKETVAKNNINGKVVNDLTRTYQKCRFYTTRHPTLTTIENKWYLRDNVGNYVFDKKGWRIKIIPKDIVLTPLVIAVWFFDDGSNTGRQAVFNTQSYVFEDCVFLSNQFRNLNIGNQVCKNRDKWTIVIKNSSHELLTQLIKPFLPYEEMTYKIEHIVPDYSTRIQAKIKLNLAQEIIDLATQGLETKTICKILNVTKGTVNGIRFGYTWKSVTNGRKYPVFER